MDIYLHNIISRNATNVSKCDQCYFDIKWILYTNSTWSISHDASNSFTPGGTAAAQQRFNSDQQEPHQMIQHCESIHYAWATPEKINFHALSVLDHNSRASPHFIPPHCPASIHVRKWWRHSYFIYTFNFAFCKRQVDLHYFRIPPHQLWQCPSARCSFAETIYYDYLRNSLRSAECAFS